MINNWQKFLLPYSQAVDELKVKFKSMRKSYKGLDEFSPIEFVTGRVKTISSIIEKLGRRGLSIDDAAKLEDISGIRIMCQLVDDITSVVDLIKARDGKDLEIVEERDYTKNIKESGYRSYHVIVNYWVYTAAGPKEVLAEIQIRTLAMNFWATIDHSINYKFEGNIPEHVKIRLKNAADAAYILDMEMSEIKDEIKDSQKLFLAESSLTEKILNKIHILYVNNNYSSVDLLRKEFYYAKKSGSLDELRKLNDKIDLIFKEIE
ncbi:GTP pyrophosphokinase family protein [Sedimentibacter sp. zth1]|uniref:GTP pyrophosphokinase n=1 Tax=Sedimentibacter sp. zth1 TaxID=2816908 RepID=UPI001A90F442|nr:GTP pyrophosphokinase family protein [Sedimentibacter sp. zth1]QSX05225.1 GTP pyrophosphokinase family protein [Sedimentibacter sp. zth1]